MGLAARIVISFSPPWEIENLLSQILQRTRESSSTTNCIKYFFCGQSFITVHALFLDVDWSKIVDVADPFLPRPHMTFGGTKNT
jgi:hypothetical protein